MKKMIKIAAMLLVVITTTNAVAQELPQPSPAAKVEQRIGLTDVAVEYSRPSAKDRVIFGDLVAHDEIWRTGANLNTLVTFSDDVKIDGQALKAGTYSFFTIPAKGEWTVMFNTILDGWGTGKHDKANDALTLKTTPIKGMYKESLSFSFENLTGTSGSMVFAWDAISIDLKIEVDVDTKAWANIDEAIAKVDDETKAGVYRNAAKHSAASKKRLEDGLKWINESIKAKESWYSYWVKADVQHAAGDNAGAITSAKKAIELGEAGAKEDGKEFGYKDRLEKSIAEYK
jgi:hypothetical protein